MPDAAVQGKGKVLQVTRRSDMSQRLLSWLGIESLSESQAAIVGARDLGLLDILLTRKVKRQFSSLEVRPVSSTITQINAWPYIDGFGRQNTIVNSHHFPYRSHVEVNCSITNAVLLQGRSRFDGNRIVTPLYGPRFAFGPNFCDIHTEGKFQAV